MKVSSKEPRPLGVANNVSPPESKPVDSPALLDGKTNISVDERRLMIAEDAYYRAERRSFAPGHEVEDWLAAEQNIERRLPSVSHTVTDALL